MQQREYRITTRAPARLRHGLCWSDVLVRNVSRRGLMLELHNPPASGTMIELRRGQIVVIGQVTWVRDGRCGVRAQDAIDIAEFVAMRRARATWQPGDGDRRLQPRGRYSDIAMASQRLARAGRWAGLSVIAVLGLYTIVSAAHSALATPMAPIAQMPDAPASVADQRGR